MNTRLAFGFDGGGTHTRAILASSDGSVLGVGFSGTTNVNIVPLQTVLGELSKAAAEAREKAGMPAHPVDAAFLGLAGIEASGKALEVARIFSEASLVKSKACLVGKDSEAALAGGLSGRPGIVLIAGTGSFCLARDADGNTHRCGGWGWLVDDVGGGSYLGREALRAALLDSDGRGPKTSLLPRLLAQLGVPDTVRLTAWIYGPAPYANKLAGLARLVTEEAQAGDAVALEILRNGAEGLAQLVHQVAAHFSSSVSPELVLVGGLARSGAPYQPLIEAALRAAVPGLRLTQPELPPAAGAVLRAFEALGSPLNAEALARLKAECARLSLV
jgi:N-acetylglucosamine kinase-like BadF-type ATPase